MSIAPPVVDESAQEVELATAPQLIVMLQDCINRLKELGPSTEVVIYLNGVDDAVFPITGVGLVMPPEHIDAAPYVSIHVDLEQKYEL